MYNILHQGSNFSYLGVFNDNLTESILKLQESGLEQVGDLSKIKKRVSFLITEGFQNVVRHSTSASPKKTIEQPSYFNIQMFDDFVGICSCNAVSEETAAMLKEKVEEIKKLDADQLKELYLKILSDGEMSAKGGAGLGLIEMARKSGKQLNVSFEQINETSSLFFLSMFVGQKADTVSGALYHDMRTEEFAELRKNHVILSYQGEFSDAVIDSIVEMLKANGDAQSAGIQKASGIAALIEILHNIQEHGKIIDGVRKGFFTLRNVNGMLEFEAANALEEKDVIKIQQAFSHLKELSPEQIDTEYLKLRSENGTKNLCFHEIFRYTKEPPTFEIDKSSEQELIFKISLTIK